MVFTKTHNSIIMRLTYKNHFRFKKNLRNEIRFCTHPHDLHMGAEA